MKPPVIVHWCCAIALCRRGYSAESTTGRLLLQKLDYLQLLLIKRAGAAVSAVATGLSGQILRGVQQGLAVAGLKGQQQQQEGKAQHSQVEECDRTTSPSTAEGAALSPVEGIVTGRAIGSAHEQQQQQQEQQQQEQTGFAIRSDEAGHLTRGSSCKESPGHQGGHQGSHPGDTGLQQRQQGLEQQQVGLAGASIEHSGAAQRGGSTRGMSPSAADAAVLLAALAATASLSDEVLDEISVERLLGKNDRSSSSSSSSSSRQAIRQSSAGSSSSSGSSKRNENEAREANESLDAAVPDFSGASAEAQASHEFSHQNDVRGEKRVAKGPVVGFVGGNSSSSSRGVESSSNDSSRTRSGAPLELSWSSEEDESSSGSESDVEVREGEVVLAGRNSDQSRERSSSGKRKGTWDLRWVGRALRGKPSSSSSNSSSSMLSGRDNAENRSKGSSTAIGSSSSRSRDESGGKASGSSSSTKRKKKRKAPRLERGAVRAARERLQRETSSAAAETSAVAGAAAARAVSAAVVQLGRRAKRTTEQLLFVLSDWGLVPRLGVTRLEVFDRVYPIREPERLKPLYIQKASLPDILGENEGLLVFLQCGRSMML